MSVTLQLKVPPPLLLTVMVCAAGLEDPCAAENARLVGLKLIAGGTGAVVTVKLTGTV